MIETDDPAEFSRLADELRQALRQQISLLHGLVDEARRNISDLPSADFEAKSGTDGQ